MNHLNELQRVIRNASRTGYFRRDQDGNEHEIAGYVVEFSHAARVRGQSEPVTQHETAVVIAPNPQAAKSAATRPYKDVTVHSCEQHHLSNPTVLRISQ